MSPKEAKKVQIRIENPVEGGNAITSLFCAKRHVARGYAVFTHDGQLRFIGRAAHLVPVACMRLATDEELRHTPVTNPGQLLRRGQHTGAHRPLMPPIHGRPYRDSAEPPACGARLPDEDFQDRSPEGMSA